MNFNKVFLGGNLTRNPEVRDAGQSTVCNFGVAVNRRWKDRNGDMQEEVCFVDCEAWGRTAENIRKFFVKGDRILLEGRLKLDSWKDKGAGANRSKIKVVVNEFTFVERKTDRTEASSSNDDIPF